MDDDISTYLVTVYLVERSQACTNETFFNGKILMLKMFKMHKTESLCAPVV